MPWIKVLPALTKKQFQILLLVLWLSLVFVAAVYFISKRIAAFDPNLTLLNTQHASIMAQVKKIPGLEATNLSDTIVHFTQQGCHCTRFSDQHKQQINRSANEDNFNVLNIELSADSIIPSTPAILIVDKLGQLMYLGPYSKGLECTKTNGFVELVLNNYQQGFNSKLVVSQAQGCYCNS